jgi:hypothetical protein
VHLQGFDRSSSEVTGQVPFDFSPAYPAPFEAQPARRIVSFALDIAPLVA